MKKFSKNSIVTLLAIFIVVVVSGFTGPITVYAAATAPTLVGSADYSILGGAAVTNTGATSASGAVGVSPGTSIGGGITAGGGAHSNDASAIAAQTDATNVYTSLNQTCDFGPVGPTDLAGATLTPGVHCYSSSVQISVGGVLTLDAQGDPNAVWIFRTGSTLTTISGASVVFLGGVGQACNVFWQVGSSATLGTTTAFIGTIIAAHDISLLTGATVNGRILARGVSSDGTVALDTNTISGPTCASAPATLNVIKHVVIDDGGLATASAWNLTVSSSNGGTGTGSAAGTESGTAYTLQAGKAYSVAESGGPSGYAASSSSNCTIASAISGATYTCTITNDDIAGVPASINVTKVVVNDNTGGKTIADFPLFVNGTPVVSGQTNVFAAGSYTITETGDPGYTAAFSVDCDATGHLTLLAGQDLVCIITNNDIPPVSSGGSGLLPPVPPLIDVVKVPNPLALPGGPGLVLYTYTLRNIGTVPVTNVTMIGDTCSPIILVSGDTDSDAQLDVNEVWVHTCTTTLTATHTNTVVATGWANGISAVDIASATVVVGVPVVPPLIHVTKIPNPLALFAAGGMVTYNETITNPGTVALSQVHLTDDKCSPVTFVSGDLNGDALLDPAEAWIYTCRANLTQTTTNTAVATGFANGLTARDFAIVTVVVAVPGFPNTGFPTEAQSALWDIAMMLGILTLILTRLASAAKKRTS